MGWTSPSLILFNSSFPMKRNTHILLLLYYCYSLYFKLQRLGLSWHYYLFGDILISSPCICIYMCSSIFLLYWSDCGPCGYQTTDHMYSFVGFYHSDLLRPLSFVMSSRCKWVHTHTHLYRVLFICLLLEDRPFTI